MEKDIGVLENALDGISFGIEYCIDVIDIGPLSKCKQTNFVTRKKSADLC